MTAKQERAQRRKEELQRRRDLKAYLIEKHGLRCMTCGSGWKWPGLSLSHIIALGQFGKTTEENCLIECQTCHDKYEKKAYLRHRIKEG